MAFGTGRLLRRRRRSRVSILVFLEWPLGPMICRFHQRRAPPFQSLFFWNGLWDELNRRAEDKCAYSFNPCFSGMAFGTPELGRQRVSGPMFQSLFFWNGLWDPVSAKSPYLPVRVSILVFLEWPLGLCRKTPCVIRRILVSILVFLEWPLGRCAADASQRIFQSFNPCFSGMAFGTRDCHLCPLHRLQFQSLFFWNGLWDRRRYYRTQKKSEVSILVFLEWPLGHRV